ncbi:MAG: cob(I)yrinic acid a,c-diamide adenosyltransferase [Verrucomicrobia bacterium]|nr:cob(I)yrinic acid a,c-diamide adenosyltransferase [Verrucomicrobiota bacterium]
MSIVTKTGDDGSTRLMFNHEVSKHDPRVDAYGAVDEFNAALGVVRGHPRTNDLLKQWVLTIQKHLIGLMGEVSTPGDSIAKYDKAGYGKITAENISEVEVRIQELEEMLGPFTDWCLPGGSEVGSLADWARVVCRRAERAVCGLNSLEPLQNESILIYLNRLSDWLWLEARLLDSIGNAS